MLFIPVLSSINTVAVAGGCILPVVTVPDNAVAAMVIVKTSESSMRASSASDIPVKTCVVSPGLKVRVVVAGRA